MDARKVLIGRLLECAAHLDRAATECRDRTHLADCITQHSAAAAMLIGAAWRNGLIDVPDPEWFVWQDPGQTVEPKEFHRLWARSFGSLADWLNAQTLPSGDKVPTVPVAPVELFASGIAFEQPDGRFFIPIIPRPKPVKGDPLWPDRVQARERAVVVRRFAALLEGDGERGGPVAGRVREWSPAMSKKEMQARLGMNRYEFESLMDFHGSEQVAPRLWRLDMTDMDEPSRIKLRGDASPPVARAPQTPTVRSAAPLPRRSCG